MINELKTQLSNDAKSRMTFSENGAIMHSSTGKALLDMNYKITSYRNASPKTIINDFMLAWEEDKDLAIKFLFFVRDVREGLGERNFFRIIFNYLKNEIKLEAYYNLVEKIGFYGRYDDIVSLIDTNSKNPETDEHNTRIAGVLFMIYERDLNNMNQKKPVTLLGKWLPSINTSSLETRSKAEFLARAWRITPRQYRKGLSSLRKHLKVIETLTSSNQWNKIDYQQVPSMANIKYRSAFLKHDEQRRREFLSKLEKGEVKINSSVAFPHDIVHMYHKSSHGWNNFEIKSQDPAIEAMWKSQKDFGLENTLVVADGSGSMTSQIGGTQISALEVANSLAIYCAEHNTGEFKNKYITFSEKPQLVDLSNADSLYGKLKIALRHNEVANTNIEAVFDLILRTAVANKMKQEDLPKTILIVSDMEFDNGTSNGDYVKDKSLFAEIAQRYSVEGYLLPRLCYWNVMNRSGGIPLVENELGLGLLSGFSVNTMKMVLSGKIDAFEALKEVLLSERYEGITC